MALVPIVLRGLPELQVPLMGAVLLVVNNLQTHTCPWRTDSANLVDVVLTAFLLLILLGAAPLLMMDREQSTTVLGWLLCIPVVGILVVAVLGLARVAVKELRNRHDLYGIFLCHHKGGAGSLCRLLKILIAKHTASRVFLDCDNLENLDFLFDIVRTATRSVVVVLTPELLKRCPAPEQHLFCLFALRLFMQKPDSASTGTGSTGEKMLVQHSSCHVRSKVQLFAKTFLPADEVSIARTDF